MERTLIADSKKQIGKDVKLRGWADTVRSHGKLVFFDLRDRSGFVQVVALVDLVKDIKEESVLEVIGQVKKRPKTTINKNIATGGIEIAAKEIKILAKAEPLPFDIKEGLNLSLPALLDYRSLTLRNEKIKAIFKIEEEIIFSFRKTMKDLGFTEFQAPTIVPVATEGGAEVFHIDYYGHDCYLAQSPQLYKQIMVSIFERVFTLAHAYRAEPSVTTRHIAEYISLDVEMGFIESWQELLDTCEIVIKNMVDVLKKNCKGELIITRGELPKIGKVPRIKMREAQEIIFQRTKRDHREEPDLDPEDEKEICQWAKEEQGSEFVFITHYPTKKRPFYTYPDPENPEYTLSFDMLFRGLEIVTGGQRINDYEKLLENVKKWGNKPGDFELYLQAFKYGMPPEGGFALGAERIVKQLLGLENLREANLFPRDMTRVDIRLADKSNKNEK